MGTVPGEQVMREPVGWQSVTPEVSSKRREEALARRTMVSNGHTDSEGEAEADELPSPNGHQTDEEPAPEEVG